METIPIDDIASLGAIRDVAPYQLPPEAWTLALNIRFRDGGLEMLPGWESILGTPGVSPHFHMPISTAAAKYWLYATLTQIFVYDGTTHTDISRLVGGAYTAGDTWQWNGTILGGIPYFNNGQDVPQFRADMAPGTRFANLTNWPGTLRARVLRSFSPYLMAFGLTDAGVVLPHTIQWSHPADPGAIPSSWNYADPTKDAGRKDLDDVESGIILDARPLSGQMIVYKENSTWRAVPIGGRYIFDWKVIFETSGILAPRCVAYTADSKRHCVVTQDDMIWHNGQRAVSVLNKRQRTTLFNDIDTVNYGNSFLFSNPLFNEIWFCYPSQGFVQPNRALIWNYGEGDPERGVISHADGITFRNAAIGNIQGDSDELWSDGVDEWDEDTGPWSLLSRRRVILAGTDAQKFYRMDQGATRDGLVFTSTLSREALALLGRKRNGQMIVDWKYNKMFSRIWPKMSGSAVNIRIGQQQLPNGAVTWGPQVVFDPATERYPALDPISGSALSMEITGTSQWHMDGYQFDVARLGMF